MRDSKLWRKIIACGEILLVVALLTVSCAKPAPTPAPASTPAPAPAPAPAPTPAPAPAPTPKPAPVPAPKPLPKVLYFSAAGVGTSGYSLSVAIGNAISQKTGCAVRVVPIATDVGRTLPLRTGEMHALYGTDATGMGVVYGLDDFSTYEWGPQSVVTLWIGSPIVLGWAVRGNSDIKTFSDFRGRRIAWVPGSPANITCETAMLAFAGLTYGDVVPISVPSMAALYTSLKDGTADIANPSIDSPAAYELEGSPFGIRWLDMPATDKEGWKRCQAYGPYSPSKVTFGAGISEKHPLEACAYGRHIYTYSGLDNNVAYAITRGVWEGYGIYKEALTDLKNWTSKQALDCLGYQVLPYHPGSITFFKEQGVWTAGHEKWNQGLIDRQIMLKKAFDTLKEESLIKGVKEKDFQALWAKKLEDLIGYKVAIAPK